MRSLWTEKEYIKSAARILDINCVYKGGLDLSKKVLRVSLGQRAVDLRTVKVGGLRKIVPIGQVRTRFAHAGPLRRIFSQTSNFDGW